MKHLTHKRLWFKLLENNFQTIVISAFVSDSFQLYQNDNQKKNETQCASVHDKVCMFFFLSSCLLITRSNFLPSPDGNSRGLPLMPSIRFENLKSVLYESEMNRIWMEVDINKGKHCCGPTALLS